MQTNTAPSTNVEPIEFPLRGFNSNMFREENQKADLETQKLLEDLFHKNNKTARLYHEFSTSEHILDIIKDKELDKEFAINFLVQVYLHKRSTPATIVGCMLNYANKDMDKCTTMIEQCIKADLAHYDEATNKCLMIYEVDKAVEQEISMYQYQLPMVIPPKEIQTNRDTGYLALDRFVVTNVQYNKDDYNLEVINIMNQVPLFINHEVAKNIDNSWKNCYQKPGESAKDYEDKKKALARYNAHAEDIIEHYVGSDYKVFLTHFYDKRGRIYARAYYLNTQGNSWNKAGLELTPERITTNQNKGLTPLEYLRIDIANNFGIKGTWNDKLDWFYDNEANLQSLIPEAKTPPLFYAGILAYEKATAGEPIGYPITFDASASGMQFLALLSGCAKSASQCNVISTGFCEDAYTNIYKAMLATRKTRANLTREELKQAVMTALYGSEKVPEDTFGKEYVGDFFKCLFDMLPGAWDLNLDIQALWNPNKFDHSWIMPDNFHVHIPVMDKEYQECKLFDKPYFVRTEVNKPLQSSRSLGPNLIHSVDSLVAREMILRCSGNLSETMKHNIANTTNKRNKRNHKMVRTLWQLFEESGFLSARILKYIDAHTIKLVDASVIRGLRLTLPDNQFDLICIHDAFRSHPNYIGDVRNQYRELLYRVAKSDLLQFMINQFSDVPLKIVKGDLDPKDVLNSEYALN